MKPIYILSLVALGFACTPKGEYPDIADTSRTAFSISSNDTTLTQLFNWATANSNNYLGNVRQWQAMFFNRKYSFTPMMNPDYVKIASAYDIPARRVMNRKEMNEAIAEMLATDGPYLLEACVIEEGNVLPMTPPGGSVNQMLLEC